VAKELVTVKQVRLKMEVKEYSLAAGRVMLIVLDLLDKRNVHLRQQKILIAH
jgi:hypothetical protein